MNEITKIHLGRQAFTISVDAYKALQDYLHDIGRQAGGKDVVEEVELRMAELLAERGVKADKVVLLEDVKYLKEQLGEPGDFSDDGEERSGAGDDTQGKRLFRDTKHGMLAGVCAGIGEFFGIDPLWVRLVFVAMTFVGGSSILIYIILWLIVPEAKTGSERLQMEGKPVTVDALKDVVERADVKGAAKRASSVVGKVVQPILKVILGTFGIGLMLAAIGAILGLTTASVYWALNPDFVPGHIFPVGASETALIWLVFLFALIMSLFLLVGGLAMVKRKWPLPSWALGAMVAVALASLAVSGALAADAVPKVQGRYEAQNHTYVRSLPEFTKLNFVGNTNMGVSYEISEERSISFRYWGEVNFTKLKTDVKDGTLTIDSRALEESLRCEKLCIFHPPILEIKVRGPRLQAVTTQGDFQGTQLNLMDVHGQTLLMRANGGSVINLPMLNAETVKITHKMGDPWKLTTSGSYRGAAGSQEFFTNEDSATLLYARNIELQFDEPCTLDAGGRLSIDANFKSLVINGKKFVSLSDVQKRQGELSPYNCVDVSAYLYDQVVNDSPSSPYPTGN